MSIENKTVMITGSNRGIGKATLEEFAKNKWNIVAHSRVQLKENEEYLINLEKTHDINITPVYFDMLDTDEMKKNIIQLKKDKITIDALVNNAGTGGGELFQMTPVSVIKDVFNVNLFAQMELTQLVLRIMAKENASIVNLSSVLGIDFRRGNTAYGASKAALIAWSKTLQTELGGRVRVNVVAPGLVDTDMGNEMSQEAREKMMSRNVINRFAQPEEVAKVIYFLSSDASSFITGQVLKVDGGGGI